MVNNRGDNTDDDGANPRLQQGSLRQFILNSNAIAGAQTSNFSIGSGLQTIAPTAALQAMTDAVVLDATTQEGFAGTPLIELDGTGAGALVDGLTLTVNNSTIRGLIVNRFAGNGIAIAGDDNLIAGNFLGVDATGTVDLGNARDGITFGGARITIGGTPAADRNVISGNNDEGVSFTGNDHVISQQSFFNELAQPLLSIVTTEAIGRFSEEGA